jgi:hypothetical protein
MHGMDNIKFKKMCVVQAELFHVGGQSDRHEEASSFFLQFCEQA